MKSLVSEEKEFIKSLEIHDILLLESDHKVYTLFNNEKLLVDFKKIGELNLVINDDLIVFEIEVELQVLDKENNLLIESKAKFASIYLYDKENFENIEIDIKEFSINFFQFSAITHILAFAREHFYSILMKSGYPRITLPLIKSLLDEEAEEEASVKLKTITKEKK